MESINETDWDLVLSSTSSEPATRILHLDKNAYYGGDEAAFSLSEAEEWAKQQAFSKRNSSFSHASVTSTSSDVDPTDGPRLASPRAYSLTLSPQLVYAKSPLVSAVVSSQIHNQLDFQAVGSWFVLHPRPPAFSVTRLTRVPSGREDVFSDTTLDLRAKRALMKFLRFVSNYEEQLDVWENEKETPFPTFLEQKFGLPPTSHAAILSLTMSEKPPLLTSTEFALPRIAQHIRSIGVFGAGFGAVLPKWGGLAEVVQVACRACAVGGGTYMLSKSISRRSRKSDASGQTKLELELDKNETVTTKWLVGEQCDLGDAGQQTSTSPSNYTTTSRSITIVSSPLTALFPRTSEGGPIPAGAVIMAPSTDINEPPVYILAHTSEAGECPMNQCVLYASVQLPSEAGYPRLEQAIASLLDSADSRDPESDEPKAHVLWTLSYQQCISNTTEIQMPESGVIVFPPMSSNLVFDDEAVTRVRRVWKTITGEDEEKFLQFEPREGFNADDEN